MALFAELRRRNVFKVALLYAVASWLIIWFVGAIQSEVALPAWTNTFVLFVIAVGFPVSLQLARIQGGDALWVHNREPVHFRETWNDDRADMLRLPGIVACSDNRDVLETLCELARDWNPERYAD